MAVTIFDHSTMTNRRGIFEFPMGTIEITIPPKVGEEARSSCPPGSLEKILSRAYVEEDLSASNAPFVWKLYEMLDEVETNGNDHIVSWVDGGKAFKVHELKPFVETIIPTYFRQSKYKSFQRQLYFYEFTRTASGKHIGAYSHPKFQRGQKTRCLSMTPKKSASKRNSFTKAQPSEKATRSAKQKSTVASILKEPPRSPPRFAEHKATGAEVHHGERSQKRSSAIECMPLEPPGNITRSLSDGDIAFVFGSMPFHEVDYERSVPDM